MALVAAGLAPGKGPVAQEEGEGSAGQGGAPGRQLVWLEGAGMQDEMYALPPGFENGAENCPQCGKHRASKNSEIHPFPEGCVVVWGEKEIA